MWLILAIAASKVFLKEFENASNEVDGFISYHDFLIDGELSLLSKYLLSKGASVYPIFSKSIDLKKNE